MKIMKQSYRRYVNYIEGFLAIIIAIGLIAFTYQSMYSLLAMDWSLTSTFYQFISNILLILVGIELIRLMIFHSFTTVLELMILIIARKMLSPDIDAISILISVIAMGIVITMTYAYHHNPIKELEDLSQ